MTAKIIPFPNPNADKAVVQLLEHQLALAKEGKTKFLAMAVVANDDVGYSAWAPYDEIGQQLLTSALGSVGFLNARFYESALAGTVPRDDEPDEAA